MNEISQSLAFWILDAWRRLDSQLQTAHSGAAGMAEGVTMRVARVASSGVTLLMEGDWIIRQNTEWPMDELVSFSFDPASGSLAVTFRNGNKMLLSESATEEGFMRQE